VILTPKNLAADLNCVKIQQELLRMMKFSNNWNY